MPVVDKKGTRYHLQTNGEKRRYEGSCDTGRPKTSTTFWTSSKENGKRWGKGANAPETPLGKNTKGGEETREEKGGGRRRHKLGGGVNNNWNKKEGPEKRK